MARSQQRGAAAGRAGRASARALEQKATRRSSPVTASLRQTQPSLCQSLDEAHTARPLRASVY
jgi:hypothetical protein